MIQEKEAPEAKPVFASAKAHEKTIVEVDLHIHELLDDFRGLTNGEILEVQMDHFKAKLEEAQKTHMKRVVFIHGDRKGRRGGGVAIYVKDTHNITVNISVRTDANTESVWVDILNGRENSQWVYSTGHRT